MQTVTFDDFKKIEIRVGKVITAEKIEGSDKLLKLIFDFGDHQRQILSGIAKYITPEELVGKQLPVIINLEHRKMMGFESQGMILCVDKNENEIAFLNPSQEVPNGSIVK